MCKLSIEDDREIFKMVAEIKTTEQNEELQCWIFEGKRSISAARSSDT